MVTTRRTTKASADPAAPAGIRILKKYPNRRLYDTLTSSYITLADVKKMVLEGAPFEVRDAKSGDELTRAILLQIILEEETGGVPMFNTQMLAQIIRFYGHAMQGVMGSYLEKNLQALAEMQSRFAEPGKGLYDASALTPMTSPVAGFSVSRVAEPSTHSPAMNNCVECMVSPGPRRCGRRSCWRRLRWRSSG